MFLRASAPAKAPLHDLGSPDLVSGDTKVVSTANWLPPHMGNPLDKAWMLRSASRVLVVTRAPPSLQILAAGVSRGPPRVARLLTGHMLHGGRQGGQEGDGTDKNVRREGGANEDDGEGES